MISYEEVQLLTLGELEVGKTAIVVSVHGEGLLRRRLLDMGITPHTKVMIRKKAPLGDPIEIYLRGYELTIRRYDANNIDVEEV